MDPAQRPPIGVGDFEQANRKQKEEKGGRRKQRPVIGYWLLVIGRRRSVARIQITINREPITAKMRRIFAPQPKQKGGKQRHKPAIAILLVGGPLEAEVAAENEPEQPEPGEEEESWDQGDGSREL